VLVVDVLTGEPVGEPDGFELMSLGELAGKVLESTGAEEGLPVSVTATGTSTGAEEGLAVSVTATGTSTGVPVGGALESTGTDSGEAEGLAVSVTATGTSTGGLAVAGPHAHGSLIEYEHFFPSTVAPLMGPSVDLQ